MSYLPGPRISTQNYLLSQGSSRARCRKSQPRSFLVVILIFSLAMLPAMSHAKDGKKLYKAASKGDLSRVSALLEKGAEVDYQDRNGLSPLLIASAYGYVDIVNALLEAGAEVNLQTPNGVTALYSASANAKIEIVQVLLAAGADVTIEDSDGKTALHPASLMGYSEVVRILLEAGPTMVYSEDTPSVGPPIPLEHGRIVFYSRPHQKGLLTQLLPKIGLETGSFTIDDGEWIKTLAGYWDYRDVMADTHTVSSKAGGPCFNCDKYSVEILVGQTIYVELMWERGVLAQQVVRVVTEEEAMKYIISGTNRTRN